MTNKQHNDQVFLREEARAAANPTMVAWVEQVTFNRAKLQFRNKVLALVSEDALPLVDAWVEEGFARLPSDRWTPAEVAAQCEADV